MEDSAAKRQSREAKRALFPSPSVVLALIALFISLTGTAVAAGVVPVARLALNSKKLQGKTAMQVAALTPGVAAFSTGPRDSTASITPNSGVPPGTIDSLAVPAGSYLVYATAQLLNLAILLFQDNSRTVDCGINWSGQGNPDFWTTLPEAAEATVSIAIPVTLAAPGPLALNCKEIQGGSDQSYVRVFRYNISALKLTTLN